MTTQSLIDEALLDEKAFREKTARLLERALFVRAPKLIRAGTCPAWLPAELKRSISVAEPDHPLDAEALRHLEALDAARWVRAQRGR